MRKMFLNLSALVLSLVFTASCGSMNKKECVKLPSAEDNKDKSSETICLKDRPVKVFTTAKDTQERITEGETLQFTSFPQPLETQVFVYIDPSSKFQEIIGIGGAITDASAETLALLPPDRQEEIIEAYFNKDNGIAYNIIRTHINSCDFSSESYTYVQNNDKNLSSFNIGHDKKYRIPFIKSAIEEAGEDVTLYASPWSPPAYMKSNDSMLHGGVLKPEFYQTWADYYIKFIKAYEDEGIPVWGVTLQNEPMAIQKWESCNYTAEQERDFLKNYLGPTFERNGMSEKKIIVWDHNRDLIAHRANIILSDPEAAKYAWGVGYHWYETWAGGEPMFANVEQVHEDYPDKYLMFTEGCNENYDTARITDWALGERYGKSMVNDFNDGASGWTDWNILLNQEGGPNHVGNYCFAPIHADTQNGNIIYTNSFYYIGHFSKFVKPGAKRISSSASRSQLLTTAFLNDDDQIVTVVMNQSDDNIIYHLLVGTEGVELTIPAHAIQTLIF